MNSVLRLMRLCLLNIGCPDRRGLGCWQIDDYWPLGRSERSLAVTSVPLLPVKGLLSTRAGPQRSLLLLFRQDWLNVFVPLPDKPLLPRGPSRAFILLPVCFWHDHPVLVRNAASSPILVSPFTLRGCRMAIIVSDSSDTHADLWGYSIEIIVLSAPQHNACQTQTHSELILNTSAAAPFKYLLAPWKKLFLNLLHQH